MHFLLLVACLASSIWVNAQPVDPTVTPAPADLSLLRRQDTEGPDFIGYIKQGDDWERVLCERGVFTTSRYWAACVNTSQTAVPTGCQNGMTLLLPETTSECQSTASCRTDWYFDHPLDTEALSMYGCVSGSRTLYQYRETTPPTPTPSPDDDTEGAGASPDDETEGTGNSPDDDSDAEPPAESTTPPDSSSDAQELAWIAGPIVGGIAGIAIIGLLVWVALLLRRNGRLRGSSESSRVVVENWNDQGDPHQSLPKKPSRTPELPDGRHSPPAEPVVTEVRPSGLVL